MDGYTNIMALAKESNFKKIIIMRSTWGKGNWCRVDKVELNPDGIYGFAYGHIEYRDGNILDGKIKCAGCYQWRTIKVLNDDMEVIHLPPKKSL